MRITKKEKERIIKAALNVYIDREEGIAPKEDTEKAKDILAELEAVKMKKN